MANPNKYRLVEYQRANILQARELISQQRIDAMVDNTGAAVAYDMGALFREGATLNADISTAAGNVTISKKDPAYDILVFVRNQWEILAPQVVALGAATELFLNWSLRRVTSAEDGTLVNDDNPAEGAANMGELVLTIATASNHGVAKTGNELEKNTSAISLWKFNAGLYVPQDNLKPGAYANQAQGGLVKTTTATATVVSTDDARMTDMRTPSDLSVTDPKVTAPDAQVGNSTLGGTRYDITAGLTKGINATKLIWVAMKASVADALQWLKDKAEAVETAYNAHKTAKLGLANTHPMPTPADVGAAPNSHVTTLLGVDHPAKTVGDTAGFTVQRASNGAGAADKNAFQLLDAAAAALAKITHDGDFYSKKADGQIITGAPGLTGGAMGLASDIAKALKQHVDQTAANPHGVTPAMIGAPTIGYVDTHDSDILNTAIAYADIIGNISVRKETSIAPADITVWDLDNPGGGPGGTIRSAVVTHYYGWIIVNIGGRIELAFGTGTLWNDESVPMPAGFSVVNCIASAGMGNYTDKNDLNSPTWASGKARIIQVADGSGNYRPSTVEAEHRSNWTLEGRLSAQVTAFAYRLLTPPPIMVKLDKLSGPVGTVVTLTGRNFGTDKTKVDLKINNVACVITSCNPTIIVFTIPALAVGTYAGTLKVNAIDSVNQTSFTVS